MKLISRTVHGYRRRRTAAKRPVLWTKKRVPIQNIGMRRIRRPQRGGFIGNLMKGLMGMRKRHALVRKRRRVGMRSVKHRPLRGKRRPTAMRKRRRVGMRKRRPTGMRKRRPTQRGHGFFDVLKNIGSKVLGVARAVPIVSTALRATGNPLASAAAGSLGLRRHRTRRMGGFKRRGFVSFGGFKRRGFVSFGGRKAVGLPQSGRSFGLRVDPKRRLIQPMRIGRPGMLMGMRRRRRRAAAKRPVLRTQRGHGVMDVLRKVRDYAKTHKLVSRGLSLIPHKYAQAAIPLAGALGYRRRRTRKMGGLKMGRYLPNVSYF